MPQDDNALGRFLRDRRTRLDPASFGFDTGRRRTPGLRREEVAQRANISPTWYTWLEQGRGGAPSTDVIERIARGLMLTEPEREHLHVLAFGHPPEASYRAEDHVTPRLQRVLDGIPQGPAIIINATWDVLAWNRAAARLLTDYAALPKPQRNVLRLVFSRAGQQSNTSDWLSVCRYLVGTFRASVARAGASQDVTQLVEELSALSPVFRDLWAENAVTAHGDGIKRLHHAVLGLIEMEFSTFTVEGRADLTLLVYSPATPETAARIRDHLARD
ncbi:helix-turn-helix transcriptional regulator [Pseudooceanicola sp. CBS1P-1]|uniref:Helix-turn-helix domain-containing protein n=1 Tax=Pseudooceanicola albus TaxID=2692189 RepID=A0A6L7G8J3_9RHOB|nr:MULTISPECIES: helix-turn-helix transcriptional regulator [Pseudooceanicola]MBT9386219.1 helix-turn-helix transcriptional regulator [Pseudooceanicola endophyticus]MXN20269.1 helix-turn-helix domain-containing protein [Pseudooceanicola albus]